jgi:Domain of unknown function (DUF4279)
MQRDELRAQAASRWQVRVHLLFLGSNDIGPEFDPHELTGLIGITPSSQWDVGSLNQLGVPKRTSGWELTSTADPTAALSEHIDSILSVLRGHEAAFSAAADRYRVQLECEIHVEKGTPSPELILPIHQLRSLIKLGIAAVGFDVGGN